MDSGAIGKLIRSEVWPVLRSHGFSHFEARTAFQYRGPFVNVVTFRFCGVEGAEIGCTPFSFAVHLSVYVKGSANEERIVRNTRGELVPREYECQFRKPLNKRSLIDGFPQQDVFYIDRDGHTVGPCFREVTGALTEVGLNWFASLNDAAGLIGRLRHVFDSGDQPQDRSSLGLICGAGSYVWHDLCATILLSNPECPASALVEIEKAMGAVMNFAVFTDYLHQDRFALRLRDLLERLDPVHREAISSKVLLSEVWRSTLSEASSSRTGDQIPEQWHPRRQLWPTLRRVGFTRFTDRFAHRIAPDRIDVVEFAPLDKLQRKARQLPEGLAHVGVGVFWPGMAQAGRFRCDRNASARPKVRECHISDWLTPESPVYAKARSVFASAQDALRAIEYALAYWFPVFTDQTTLPSVLTRRDLHLYCAYPLLSGLGSQGSVRRLVLLAHCAALRGSHEEAREYVALAESSLELRTSKNLKTFARDWIDCVKMSVHTD